MTLTPKQLSDRELLELAAKAAGYSIFLGDDEEQYRYGECAYVCPNSSSAKFEYDCRAPDCLAEHPWNPLNDDGDALRLAVRAKLQVAPETFKDGIASVYAFGRQAVMEHTTDDMDIFSATRRAIVRAAAEIGKSMKEG